MAELLHMGGYAAYVWPAFGIVLALLAGLALSSWRGWRQSKAALAALQGERRPGRERP